MSGLRQKVLEVIRMLGNHSGCHQMPERSFFYKGRQFPVCARCTGVLIGQALALLLSFIRIPIWIAAICLGIMGIDWGVQEINLKSSTNRRRMITGILGGFGLYTIWIAIVKRIIRLFQS